MQKQTQELVVKGNSYVFVFEERVNMWRSLDNEWLIDQYSITIEIKVTDLATGVNWDDVGEFLDQLAGNRQRINENIRDAQTVLGTYFNIVNKEYYNSDFLNEIIFTPTAINYKGRHPYEQSSFLYDYFFFPHYAKNIYEDIGAIPYMAYFKDFMFLGIYCDM